MIGEIGQHSQAWAGTLRNLAQVPFLSLKELSLDIDGQEDDLVFTPHYGFRFNFMSESVDWIHALWASVKNLDRLGITYSCYIGSFNNESYQPRGLLVPLGYKVGKWVPMSTAVVRVEQELWDYLAPEMLKQYGTQGHDGATLRSRRIIQCDDEEDGSPSWFDNNSWEDEGTQRKNLM